MARKLKLLVVEVMNEANGKTELFEYGRVMKQILGYAAQGRGLVFAEIEAALTACAPITAAIEAGADEVTVTEEQYKLLREKLETFPWAMAHQAIVNFGGMIRNAPELTGGNDEATSARPRALDTNSHAQARQTV